MNPDYTQQQSIDGLIRSEKLSLQTTVPPNDIPGYKIDKLLGQGAFGQVWLGSDLNTGRKVAIKFYLHSGGVNWSLLSREVEPLVNMSTGRYIVQVLAVGWEAEPPYYIMEYFENGSLEDLIRSKGALGISEAVSLLREIADGLSFAHGKGVLHCDLKPANIVLDHDHRPRLVDFGQSRMSDDQTPSLGTLFYMAPEQSDLTASPDAAWDVYALGAIAYTMLVGSPPYRTSNVVESLDTASSLPDRLKLYRETILHSPRPKLHYRRRGIDKALCQIVDRCLATKVENRYRNVQQVIGAIDSWKRSRTRRPLYILGIVGPILLLTLMMLFSSRSINVARQIALQRMQQGALESNSYAAKFAARTLENELESLFRLIELETRRDAIKSFMRTTISENEQHLSKLAVPKPNVEDINAFKASSAQQELQQHLKSRLNALITYREEDDTAAIYSSLLINDARGTNIATVFSNPREQTSGSPVGKNFAYRSYFTGRRADGDSTKPRSEFSPTRATRLSASFHSTSTGKWKLGISAPVWDDPAVADEDNPPTESVQPLGVLVLTINLGDFELLRQDDLEAGVQLSRFAALIDGRAGEDRGALLQHPLMQTQDQKTLSKPQLDAQQLRDLQSPNGLIAYRDPASDLPGGEPFAGDWIAAMHQVGLPRESAQSSSGKSMSDLWVLVQERGSVVAAPLSDLGWRLQVEWYIAFAVQLTIILAMWFFVFRIGASFRESSRSIERDPESSTALSQP